MIYTPDVWVILEIQGPGYPTIYKVLAGWYGGFAGADEWKLNSGITKVVDCGAYYEVHGYSGSVYKCHKETERLSSYTGSILAGWQERGKKMNAKFEVVSIEKISLELIA